MSAAARTIIDAIKYGCVDLDTYTTAQTLTKDELESHPEDILAMAVRYELPALITILLKRGLRSGHALDIAVRMRDIAIVSYLLDMGIEPSRYAESLAGLIGRPDIASIILAKRQDTYWFSTTEQF